MSRSMAFIFVVIATILLSHSNCKHPLLPEITDEKLADTISSLREENEDLHKYLLKLIIDPSVADLNKDRKISPKELRESLQWLVMPKNNELKQQIHPEALKTSKAGLDLFLTAIQYSLTYRQFQELLTRVRLEHFFDPERAKINVAAKQNNIERVDDL